MNMKKSYKLSDLIAQCDSNAPAPKDEFDLTTQEQLCDHDWQPDGQTLTAVRWTCTKCHKTKLNGLDI